MLNQIYVDLKRFSLFAKAETIIKEKEFQLIPS